MQEQQDRLFVALPFSGLEECGISLKAEPDDAWFPHLEPPLMHRHGPFYLMDRELHPWAKRWFFQLEQVIGPLSRGDVIASGDKGDVHTALWNRRFHLVTKWWEPLAEDRSLKKNEIELRFLGERLHADALPEPWSSPGRELKDQWFKFEDDERLFRDLSVSPFRRVVDQSEKARLRAWLQDWIETATRKVPPVARNKEGLLTRARGDLLLSNRFPPNTDIAPWMFEQTWLAADIPEPVRRAGRR